VNPPAPTASPPPVSTPLPTHTPSDGYFKWRLLTHEDNVTTPEIWQMLEMEFHDDSNCDGTKREDGEPIDSKHPSDTTGPDKAFDGNLGTKWGGRSEDGTQDIWIGKDFKKAVNIGCIRFTDDKNKNKGTTSVKVQGYDTDWRTILSSDHTPGNEQVLPITQGPGPSPPTSAPIPTTAPNSAPTPATAPTPIGEEVYLPNETGDISYKKMRNRNPDCEDYVGTYFADVKLNNQDQLTMDFEISAEATKCVLKSNNIPNHDVGGSVKPNKSDYILNLPRNPVKTDVATYVEKKGGKLTLNGILLNGVDLDMDSAFCYNPAFDTPNNISLGKGDDKCGIKDYHWYAVPAENPLSVQLDAFAGHPYNGRYHYHGDNDALSFLNAAGNVGIYGSPVVGFAPDGFPIYGHYFYDASDGEVKKANSSWKTKDAYKNGRTALAGATFPPPDTKTHKLGMFVEDYEYVENHGDLDECNGMTDAFGNYGYYYTEIYPYGPRCTFGTPDDSFTKDGCEYNPDGNACKNRFAFVVSNSNMEHGHEHGTNSILAITGAAEAASSISVVAITATVVAVVGVL